MSNIEVGDLIKLKTIDEDYDGTIATVIATGLSEYSRRRSEPPIDDNSYKWYDVLVRGEVINLEEWEIDKIINKKESRIACQKSS